MLFRAVRARYGVGRFARRDIVEFCVSHVFCLRRTHFVVPQVWHFRHFVVLSLVYSPRTTMRTVSVMSAGASVADAFSRSSVPS